MRKILIVTGTRAEYGLLKGLINKLQSDDEIEAHVAVTGAHLSACHGMTVEIIKKDNIKNLHYVDMEINGDGPIDLCDGIANGLRGFSRLLITLKPDLLIVLGDRYELWGPSLSATIANVPIAHIHGGESTEGLIDEAVRHSLTKMSHLHFCSHDLYRKRIINMGESPDRVWNVGAIGLDRIRESIFVCRSEIEKRIGTKMGKINILCTFHPVTLDETESSNEVDTLIRVLEKFVVKNKDLKIFVTMPNADTFSSYIRKVWEDLIKRHTDQVFGFSNLGDQFYLSLMKEVDAVIGNSSSGILEAPFLNKATVDVGRRQQGRLKSRHIIHSDGSEGSLESALNKALSKEFQEKVKTFTSIYGTGHTIEKIFNIIKTHPLEKIVFKEFHDGLSI